MWPIPSMPRWFASNALGITIVTPSIMFLSLYTQPTLMTSNVGDVPVPATVSQWGERVGNDAHETNAWIRKRHYSDVTMSAVASQITGISTVFSIVCSGAHYRKHQNSASLAFERGTTGDRGFPSQGANYAVKFPIDDVILDDVVAFHENY